MNRYFFSRRGVSLITLIAMLVSQFGSLGLHMASALDTTFVVNQTVANAAAGANTQTNTALTTTANVAEVKASQALTVLTLPTDTQTITIGLCVITFTTTVGSTADEVDCTDNTATIDTDLGVGDTPRTPSEVADVLDSLTNVSDTTHGALTIGVGGASTTVFTTTLTEMSATDITFTDGTAGNITNVAVTGIIPVAQIDTFTPANVEIGDSFRITIGATNYDFVATVASVQNVVEGLQPLVDANAAVTCTEDDLKVTCTADVAGTAFTGSSTATNLPAVAQVVTFTPATPTDGETLSGSINGNSYTYTITGSMTVAQVVTAFQPLIDADAAVVCTDDATTVTCTAASPGTAFTFSSEIVDITAPVAAEVTPVVTPASDTTPDYTFSSTQTGAITYGGDCSSSTTGALIGSNTVTFNTLSGGVHSNCTITVTDDASNTGNVLAVTTFTIDTTEPTVVLSTSAPDPTNGAFTVTATFSEAVTGVLIGDFVVSSGTTSAFSGVSPTVYTVLVTPTSEGVVTIDMGTGAAMDLASNNSVAAAQLSRTYDSVAPIISSISASLIGTGTGVTYGYTVSDTHSVTSSIYLGTGLNVLSTLTTSGSTSGTGAHTGSLSGLSAGVTYYYYISSTDAAGNNAISSTGTLTGSDNVGPVVSNKHVDNITETTGTVKFDFTDLNYTVGTGTGYITLGTGASLTNIGTGYLTIITGSTNNASSAFTSLVADTTYNYSISITDNVGNNSSASTGSFVTSSAPVALTGGTVTETGATTLTGTITVGTTFDLSGTTLVISSDLGDTNSVTGTLTLSGVTGITVSGSTSWNGILLPPTLIQSGSAENASSGEISTIIPQTTIVTVGSTTTRTTYTSTILATVKLGGENGVSLIASGSNFRVSFIVSAGTVGNVLRLYRSTNGSTWEVNSPDLTCTLDAQKLCTFETNHLSFFAPTLIASSASSVTASSGGGGGGGGSYIPFVPAPTTTGSTTVVPPVVLYPTSMSSFSVPIVIHTVSAIKFTDIGNNWARNDILKLATRGIINNVELYNPNRSLTRAEFLKIVLKSTGWDIPTGSLLVPYNDIAINSWHAQYVSLAASKGIISLANRSFRPNDPITRAEAAKILMITLGVSVDDVDIVSFADLNRNSDLSKYVEAAKAFGILSGQIVDGRRVFRPNDPITRSEIAKIIAKAFNL